MPLGSPLSPTHHQQPFSHKNRAPCCEMCICPRPAGGRSAAAARLGLLGIYSLIWVVRFGLNADLTERESIGLLQNVLYKGNEHGCDTIPPSLQLSKLLLTCTIRPVSQSFCVYTVYCLLHRYYMVLEFYEAAQFTYTRPKDHLPSSSPQSYISQVL